MESVAQWLRSLGLAQYAQVFAENGIDLSVVRHLTDQDLKEIGILLGHRRKIMSAAAELEVGTPTPSTTIEMGERNDAERRLLSIMFCDLVGSTALSARIDPEEMREVLANYHTCVAETIGRFNGTIAKYTGDGVLAYFGYPRAYEDDTTQAVRAGLALIEALRTRNTSDGATLEARVGIATGTVVVGDHLGEGMAHEQAVVGETPNLAARLQAHAEPGTVLICAETHRLTAGHFSYRDLGLVTLKGWLQPISVYQVLALSGEESRFEAQHKNRMTSLLGRDEELEVLLHRWRQAVNGEGCAVVLTGEPGIGKSHIILALQERLQSEPHSMLRFFCSPQHTHSALYPFVGQLSRAARFDRNDTPAQKIAKLETLVSQVSNNSDGTLALFASLLSLPPDARYALPALTPQKLKERSLAALIGQLVGIAARQPTLVIFEDAHWMDPTSLDLLTLTLEQVPQMSLLLVVTARPEFIPPWPGHSHVKTIPLNRLSRRDGLALIGRTAGGKPLPEAVVTEILARTDGIPLFVEELTKMIIESGFLLEQQGQYLLDKPLPSHAIPTTLHASLMARLDRLAPVRDVAQIGAVVGREFSYELVSAIAGVSRARLEEALDELVRSELVFRRGEIPQAIYSFRHALVRDAAYAGLLKSRRVQLHAAIATVFEERFPDIAETQPETLAHHLAEAGLHEKAAGYWLRAGKIAGNRFANVEAIAHLHRGIECVGGAYPNPRQKIAWSSIFKLLWRLASSQRRDRPQARRSRPSPAPARCVTALAIRRNTFKSCYGWSPRAWSAENSRRH
jgi:class 3 adenylate cyclase